MDIWHSFRKKPIQIMAFQFRSEDAFQILVKTQKTTNTGILTINGAPIKWTDYCTYGWSGPSDIIFEIETLEGNHKITDKDWIIQGITNELYPCKPDIFGKTYEKVV